MESLFSRFKIRESGSGRESQIWSGLECFSLDGDVIALWTFEKNVEYDDCTCGAKNTIRNVGKPATKIAA